MRKVLYLMLKKKLKDGRVVGLSLESVQGGVLLTLDEQPTDSTKARKQQSFMLNPGEVSEFIDGLSKQKCCIRAIGKMLVFRSPQVWEHEPIHIAIKSESVEEDIIIFPLYEHEIRFIRKALEHMAESLLFVGTWSGDPEEF